MTIRRWLSSLRLRVRTLFQKKHVERELDEELQFHVEQQGEMLMGQGLSAKEARRVAMRSLGVERQMEKCRDVRAWQWLEVLGADVKFGLRQLKKNKVTTVAAVLSLALGVGSCVAAFRLVNALFLRPLPVSHPEQLYEVSYKGIDVTGTKSTWDATSYGLFDRMRKATQGSADLIPVSYIERTDLTYGGQQETEKAYSQYVAGWMFADFGLAPAVGRLLTADDERTPGAAPYAVISYDYWTRRFGRDPKVIGRTFRTDRIFEIVGVAPRGFTGMEPGSAVDVFVPLTMNTQAMEGDHLYGDQWLRLLVRVRPRVDAESVRSRLDVAYRIEEREQIKNVPWLVKQLADGWPKSQVELKRASSGISNLQETYRTALMILSVLAGLVLLIACANVANLMSAQTMARAREMAVRVSLGAGRMRLVRLVMMESAMMGTGAAAGGLLFAWWATPYVVRHISTKDAPVQLALGMDWIVVLFAVAVTVGMVVLFGLGPALRAFGARPAHALKGGDAQAGRMRWMQITIPAQVAFCCVVLFAAGLFVRTFERLEHRPLGFEPERLLLVETAARHEMPLEVWEQTADKLRAIPGVERVSLGEMSFLSRMQIMTMVGVDGDAKASVPVRVEPVTPGWLETMRVPLEGGRDLREEDVDPGVVVVNSAFARQFFSGSNPIGHSFLRAGRKDGHTEIVGLAGDTVYSDLRGDPVPILFVPQRHIAEKDGSVEKVRWATFAVRTANDGSMGLAETIRKTIADAQTEMTVSTVRTQQELIDAQTMRERLLGMLGGFFAVVALLLAVIGLYGVLQYTIVRREKEIGIRLALGAAAGNIARLVTVRIFAMVVAGAVIGLGLGMASVRYVSALLYGVKATDASMVVVPAMVLLGAAGLAALPAVLRAVRIDPAEMLRAE